MKRLTPFHLMNKSHDDYFVHETSIIDDTSLTTIGKGTRIWHWCHIVSGAVIGEDCVLGQNCYVGGAARLGDNVRVQNNVSIYDQVILEDDVFCGPSMVFTNVINPRSHVDRKAEYLETRVCKGASIGANATIICGNKIGKYAFIAAGAVVTKNIPDYALVAGVPARQLGWVSRSGQQLQFDDSYKAVCPETGETYILTDHIVKLENK